MMNEKMEMMMQEEREEEEEYYFYSYSNYKNQKKKKKNNNINIKKGPWSSEEDEVLMKHVSKYGPRDWSSLRSNGLLPRTGKSCRLRWVNKLQPNLKTGCKFSAEEERLVIELQGQFGNKWAKIATYLQGRTDNDVKNFWSSRRKRLERMLQTQKNKRKKAPLPLNQEQVEEVTAYSTNQEVENLCNPIFTMGNTEVIKMVNLPDLTKPNYYQNLGSEHLNEVAVEANRLHMVPSFASSTEGCNFPLVLPETQLKFPLFPECQELIPEPIYPNFIDMFEQKTCPECVCSQHPLGLEGNSQSASNSNSSFFKDFPTDIFNYFEHMPPSSSQQ